MNHVLLKVFIFLTLNYPSHRAYIVILPLKIALFPKGHCFLVVLPVETTLVVRKVRMWFQLKHACLSQTHQGLKYTSIIERYTIRHLLSLYFIMKASCLVTDILATQAQSAATIMSTNATMNLHLMLSKAHSRCTKWVGECLFLAVIRREHQ